MFASFASAVAALLVGALLCLGACGSSSGAAGSAGPFGPAPPRDPEGAAISRALARHHEESGGGSWSRVAFLESRMTITLGGMTGEATQLSDVRTGKNRNALTIGPLSMAQGYDGQVSWRYDPGGELVVEDSPVALALARTSAWLTRNGYFHQQGAAYRWLGAREELSRRYAVVEAVPEGGAAITLWFDEATGLLARSEHLQGKDVVVTHFEDYRAVEGVKVPFRIVVDSGDPRNLTTMELRTVKLLAASAVAAEAFARPADKTDHLSFAGPERHTELPFELVNNHIYIQAKINDQPVRMLVDTGGLNLLTAVAARRLGLATSGNIAGSGAGEQKVDVAFAKAGSMQVGTLKVRDPLFYVFDFAELLTIEDVAFDGLVGFELFHRYVVRIDYAAGKIRLWDPAGFTPPPGATAVPFVLEGRVPLVDGQIDGMAARFTIDTGSRASLTASSPFVARQKLVEKYKPRFQTITGWGVGGPVRSQPVRFREVKIGGAVVRDLVGDLYTGEHGAFADPRADANLGGGILRRYTVTFDYGKRVMYLEPNARHGEHEGFDRSGLFVIRQGDALEVAAVAAGSPAERAGVRVKDLIRAVDGVAADAQPLAEWRRRFRETKVGAKLTLTVERDGAPRTMAMTLAELVP